MQKYKIIVVSVFLCVFIFPFLSEDACAKKMITIGISQWVSNVEFDRNIQGFKDGLAEKGYVEGENIRFILENPKGKKRIQRVIMNNYRLLNVDLIFVLTTPGVLIAKEITMEIPVVFSIVAFPVEVKIIDSLLSSKNNFTGTRNYVTPARQYFTFNRVFPHTKTMAFVHRKDEINSSIQLSEYQKLFKKRNINIVDIAAVDLDDMRVQLEKNQANIDSVYSACDTLIQSGGEEIVIAFSKTYKKPNFTCNKDGVLKGALVGNVTDFYSLGKMSGEKAAIILQGTKPTYILTESPREDFIIVNTRTATEIGITIPRDVLDEANEIVGDQSI